MKNDHDRHCGTLEKKYTMVHVDCSDNVLNNVLTANI
jgi:hypothetical protein